jgi:hypothetical protein
MKNSQGRTNNSIDESYEKSLKEVELLIYELHEHKFLGIIVNKTINISSEKTKLRVFEIVKLLNSDKIDIKKLKELIFEGLPDDISSLRSLTWKLLMNYLPFNLNEWENHIDKKRSEYISAKEKIITKLELDKLDYQKSKNKNTEKGNFNNNRIDIDYLNNDNNNNSYFMNKLEGKNKINFNNNQNVEILDIGKLKLKLKKK